MPGQRAPPAKECHGEETNCVPTKAPDVSFTLLTDCKKWSGGAPELMFGF